MNQYTIYCDGLCEPQNPNGYACWAFVVLRDGQEIHNDYGCVGHGEGMSNNIAEYNSLLNALYWCHKNKVVGAAIKMDSQLVVNQVNATWKCNKEHLQKLLVRCSKGMQLTESTLAWVPREKNEVADRYSRVAYNQARKEFSFA